MENIGQVMLDISGTELSQEDCELIDHPDVGGLIFFTRNYESPEQIKALVDSIRKIKKNIIIAVDQEGGRVQRFLSGFSTLAPLGTLGEQFELNPEQALENAEKHAYLMASELKAIGIDISFAPVLDRNIGINEVIGNRSFHADPDVISTIARAYIKGMNRAGMCAVGKHFPGHGCVTADSHHELPIDERDFETIKKTDMIPFSQLSQQLSGMMCAHIRYPSVDDKPAGFSSRWLREILREELKFNGVIFSDCLSMAGAKFAGSYPDRAALATEAGCDMVLVCNNREGAVEVLDNFTPYPDEKIRFRLNHFIKATQ